MSSAGTLLGAFLVCLAGGLLITSSAVRFGRRANLVVRPRLFGKSESAITYLGGPALAATAVSTYLVFGRPGSVLKVLLAACLAVLVVGLIDDVLSARHQRTVGREGMIGLNPTWRLAVEAGIATVAWSQGLSAFSTAPPLLDMVITVVFLVGGMNAFNLIDNMDGVAGTTATLVAFGVAALALAGNHPQFALLSLCIAGASTAFLCFNFRRPSAYLGDAGSLFLGLLLSGMALSIDVGFAPPGNFIAAVVIFAVPFTDTATRQLSRWAGGGSLFDITGSTDHLSHRLVAYGFRPSEVAGLHGAAGLFASSAAGIAATYLHYLPLLMTLAAFGAFGLSFVWAAGKSTQPALSFDPAARGLPLGLDPTGALNPVPLVGAVAYERDFNSAVG
jgi:UDP-GlcNAc:undecaprenyl-phosphate/decaprenyl-phosphate GlcNAc-1-phosphate transferase